MKTLILFAVFAVETCGGDLTSIGLYRGSKPTSPPPRKPVKFVTKITPHYESSGSITESPTVSYIPTDPILESQKQHAAKGFAPAQFALGVRHLSGDGVEKDEVKAVALLKLSAAQGNEKAKAKLREIKK